MFVAWVTSPYVEIEEVSRSNPVDVRRYFVGGYRGSISDLHTRYGFHPPPKGNLIEELRKRYWDLQTRKELLLDAHAAGQDPTKLVFHDSLHELDTLGPQWMNDWNFKEHAFEETTADMIEFEEVIKKQGHEIGKGTYWKLPSDTKIAGWWGPEAPETIQQKGKMLKAKKKQEEEEANPNLAKRREFEWGSSWKGRGRKNPVAKLEATLKSEKKKARRAGDREARREVLTKSVDNVNQAVQARLAELRAHGSPITEAPSILPKAPIAPKSLNETNPKTAKRRSDENNKK